MNQEAIKNISRMQKGPPRDIRRAFPSLRRGAKGQSFLPAFSASPRMSPSDAPESDEPYCATACFSSAICSALTEKFGFFERSKPMTIASNFWPRSEEHTSELQSLMRISYAVFGLKKQNIQHDLYA